MRMVVVGDVHGCLEELDELLRAVSPRPGIDKLVFVGDLIDRGPDPVGVVRRVRELKAGCVLGNHEEKAMRWLRNEALRLSVGRKNSMKPPDDVRRKEWESLSEEDRKWIGSLPLTYKHEGWIVVHAGFETGRPLEDQREDKLLRVRWVDASGKMVPSSEGSMGQPSGSVVWAERWTRTENVVYGHAVHSFGAPRVDWPSSGVCCIGIDTGCVFGGRLTAALITGSDVEYVQVRASREHFQYDRRADERDSPLP